MKEKILALLLAKFAGVRKDGLAQLAKAMTIQAEDETEATALVEKISLDKVNEFVKDWRKDVDKEVSEGNKTYKKTIEEKFDLVEKKADPSDPADPNKKTDPNDMAAIIAAEVAKAVGPLSQQLATYKGQEVTKSRLQTLEGKLKDVPETFKNQKLKDFGRMSFETDEAFNEYLAELDTDIPAFTQELADKGLGSQSKPFFSQQNKTGVSTGVASYIETQTGENKSLEGKKI